MKRFARAFAVTLGLVVLGSVISLVPQKNAAGAGGAPVTVVNTPLPVTGNVNAAVTGAVGVNNFPAFPTTLTGATVPVSGSVTTSFDAPSHLGVKPSQFVNLFNSAGLGAVTLGPWQRIGADGSLTSFSIPQGQLLVVTDIELSVDGGTPGDTVSALIRTSLTVLWTSPIVVFDTHTHAQITDHLIGGLALTYLPEVGIEVFTNSASFSFNLQGYLTALR